MDIEGLLTGLIDTGCGSEVGAKLLRYYLGDDMEVKLESMVGKVILRKGKLSSDDLDLARYVNQVLNSKGG